MKEYIKPQIDVVVFETADVLMTSGEQLHHKKAGRFGVLLLFVYRLYKSHGIVLILLFEAKYFPQ